MEDNACTDAEILAGWSGCRGYDPISDASMSYNAKILCSVKLTQEKKNIYMYRYKRVYTAGKAALEEAKL